MKGSNGEHRRANGQAVEPRGRRRRYAALFAGLAVLAGLALVPTGAGAVHGEGLIELDGDSANGGASGVDFDTVFKDNQDDPLNTNGFEDNSFSHDFIDDTPQPDFSHHQPSNKDEQVLGEWGCVRKPNVSNKDDIRHASSAAYIVGGETIVYAMLTRDSNNGDANAGFWFFQDQVACTPTALGGSGDFTGEKTHGDVFIVSAFSGGGDTATLDIYRWNDPTPLAPESGDETLDLDDSVSADCDPSDLTHDPGEAACARVNNGSGQDPINTEWGDTLELNTYYEVGINLNDVLNEDICISSFLGETRSSTTLESNLFDIAFGSLNTCGNLKINKYVDLNGDGDRDTGEPPGQWLFTVVRQDDDPTIAANVVCSGTTDELNGELLCPSLLSGSYDIYETQVAGFYNTQRGTTTGVLISPPNPKYTATVSVGPDTVATFGNICFVDKTFRITGVPEDGAKPTSITVEYDKNNLNSYTSLTLTESASEVGVWEGSINNTFLQTDTLDWRWYINSDTANKLEGGIDESLQGANPTTPSSNPPTDTGCRITNTDEFTVATLNGLKFKDINADGDKDAGEPGLGGFQFTLKRGTTVIATTTSSAVDGTYSFSNVPPGTYTVSESAVSGWQQTAPSGGTATVVVDLGDTSVAVADFGNTPLSDITITFNPLTSPAKTKATSISCVDGSGASVGSNTNSNSLTTDDVTPAQSSVVCTVTFEDP